MLSMVPHLHLPYYVAGLPIVLVVALTATVTVTALGLTRGHRQGGIASTPTRLDTNQRPLEGVIEIILEEELAAAAAMSWADEDAAVLLYTCGSGLDDGLGDA
jgi:hypothetical protein